MTLPAIGYQWLIERYALPARALDVEARLDSRIKARETRRQGNIEILAFESKYHPGDTLVGHIQFALRYEGINLEVLALLFEQTGEAELNAWLTASPDSTYARRAGYLYEWLTKRELKPQVPTRRSYVPVLDTAQQFGPNDGPRDSRFRVIDNLPGTPDFCPLVRRTEFLDRMVASDLKAKTRETLAKYDMNLLQRAAAFLYLKETQSSFELEREKPSHSRAQRFADLLRQTDSGQPLTEERLAELQHAVVDPRFHEFTWRGEQNWVGKDIGFRKQVDFIPPRPEDVPRLMRGLLDTAAKETDTDAVIMAATIAFGFVFIHPFMDGNGRIHRYLIHEVLAKAGFTPSGIILPVSAVILASVKEYITVLETFSTPLRARTDWNPDTPDVPAQGNDALYYRYFDATTQAEFLYRALERTVAEDLQQEVGFLIGFDRARSRLNELYDWPGKDMDLFVRLVHQNDFKLSETKRSKLFDWMSDDELATAEQVVANAFTTGSSAD